MRPHRLTLTAFGPFAEQVTVDFDRMTAGGLFLLQGDTGSGKTSILDGLAFALYGRVPGQRAGVNRLRSDHAEPAVRTCVELEVTIAGRRLRIQRWPEQERPKLRGAGTTKDQAKILLQEAVDGGWAPVSERVGEADAELIRLLGMSVDQFHQVVLLPQGEFARFLRSGAAERAQLLQRLFATDRFRRVEDWLAERRRSCSAALAAAEAAVLRTAARVAQAAGLAEPELGEEGIPPQGWATSVAEQAADAAQVAESDAERTRKAQADAEAVLHEAREMGRRQSRRRELLSRQSALEQQRPALTEAEARLDEARRAAELRGGLEQRARRRAAAAERSDEVRRGRRTLEPFGLAEADAAQLRAAAELRRRRLGRLDEARRLEQELREVAGQRETAERGGLEARRRSASLEKELADLPQQRKSLDARLADLDGLRLRIPVLEADAARLRRAARDAARLESCRTERSGRGRELLEARESAVSLREEATRLRTERVDSMIAELAAALVDGDPCPVCGASEHPDPSEVRGSRVTREQEDAARAAAEQAQQVVADLSAAVARLDAEIEGLEVRLAEADAAGSTAGALATDADRTEREVGQARRAVEDTSDLAEQRRRLDEREREQRELLALARGEIESLTARAADAEARGTALGDRLASLLDGAADVDTAFRREERVVQAVEALLGTLDRAAAAEQEVLSVEADLAAGVVAAGFPDVAAAERALLAPDEVQQLQRTVDEWRSADAALGAALADPDVDVALDPPAVVTDAETALVAARAAARAGAAAAVAARSRADELERLVPAFETELRAVEPLRERAAEVRRLADLAAGQGANRLRMTLSAYVLAARLEEVAAVASERLRRMTQGRYTLVHTDGAVRGGARSGLGLLARDSWTGQDRDTATLSGGETFLASLALALALGDVVTAESGGADIEALFVDEGFGSLDDETLEEVMDTLDGLREGGRMVGLVSHVGELRARVPAQIRVRKGRRGSTVEVAD